MKAKLLAGLPFKDAVPIHKSELAGCEIVAAVGSHSRSRYACSSWIVVARELCEDEKQGNRRRGNTTTHGRPPFKHDALHTVQCMARSGTEPCGQPPQHCKLIEILRRICRESSTAASAWSPASGTEAVVRWHRAASGSTGARRNRVE